MCYPAKSKSLAGASILTKNQTEGVAEWRLTPNQTGSVDGFSGAIDVTASHPSGCNMNRSKTIEQNERILPLTEPFLTGHCKDAHEQANGSSGQHHFLLGVVAGGPFSSCPNAHQQDEQIEQDDADQSANVDHSPGTWTLNGLLLSQKL